VNGCAVTATVVLKDSKLNHRRPIVSGCCHERRNQAAAHLGSLRDGTTSRSWAGCSSERRTDEQILCSLRLGSVGSDSMNTYRQQDRFREEAIMSMAHRISTAGVGADRHAPRIPRGNLRGRGHAEPESVTSDTAGSIISYPWEGLYQGADETIPSSP
jgi:hypothetical protein